MGEAAVSREPNELVCPHCHKPFAAELIAGGRHRGFKCPHCRLFVPLDRAGDGQGSGS
jgi:tRNA(Ile2) C34 agmatinyltransferase TiaS